MSAAQPSAQQRRVLAALGLGTLISGLVLGLNLLLSLPAQGRELAQSGRAGVLVNGRAVFAVPVVTGPEATAILQGATRESVAYAVHRFPGLEKAVSTPQGWFRCAALSDAGQYSGSQVEAERWVLLSEQQRLEIQAACTF